MQSGVKFVIQFGTFEDLGAVGTYHVQFGTWFVEMNFFQETGSHDCCH